MVDNKAALDCFSIFSLARCRSNKDAFFPSLDTPDYKHKAYYSYTIQVTLGVLGSEHFTVTTSSHTVYTFPYIPLYLTLSDTAG